MTNPASDNEEFYDAEVNLDIKYRNIFITSN